MYAPHLRPRKAVNADKSIRTVKFMDTLVNYSQRLMPDVKIIPMDAPSKEWKTTRLRPQLIQIIETMQERYEAQTGIRLSTSEVIAAVFSYGLHSTIRQEEGFNTPADAS